MRATECFCPLALQSAWTAFEFLGPINLYVVTDIRKLTGARPHAQLPNIRFQSRRMAETFVDTCKAMSH
jgi:hypothetical protein